MDQNQIITLEIPNNLSFLPLVIESARSVAGIMRFPENEIRKIEIGVEEAVGNIIRYAFEENTEELVKIQFLINKQGLGISVFEKGLPFDPSTIKEFSVDDFKQGFSDEGLGIYLMKKFMDEFSFINHGKEGKETRLFKYFSHQSLEEVIGKAEIEKAGKEREALALPRGSVDYSVRKMLPEEAVEVARCAYTSYGYTYVHESIYYPERVREMNEAGELFSYVAVNNANNDVMAHLAMEKENDPGVPQLGVAATKPLYRGHGCMKRLNEIILEDAKKMNLHGVYARCITTHPISQKNMIKIGLHPCALLLSSGKERRYKGIEQKKIQRESVFLHFLQLNPEEGLKIYAPPKHIDIISRIYDSMGREYTNIRVHDNKSINGNHSIIESRINTASLTANIYVKKYGKDLIFVLNGIITRLCRDKLETLYIYLPIVDEPTAFMCEEIEKLGFFFAGIMPASGHGDMLILQYLNNHIVDFECITTASDDNQSILNYVKQEAGF